MIVGPEIGVRRWRPQDLDRDGDTTWVEAFLVRSGWTVAHTVHQRTPGEALSRV